MAGNFATWLNTATLPEFSDLTIKQFTHVKEMITPAAAQLFIQEDLTSWGSDQKRYDEVDVETFAKIKKQGENAQRARAGVGYSKTMTARRYAQQYAGQVKADLYQMNHFIPQRFELNLSHIFSFAGSTLISKMSKMFNCLQLNMATA